MAPLWQAVSRAPVPALQQAETQLAVQAMRRGVSRVPPAPDRQTRALRVRLRQDARWRPKAV